VSELNLRANQASNRLGSATPVERETSIPDVIGSVAAEEHAMRVF